MNKLLALLTLIVIAWNIFLNYQSKQKNKYHHTIKKTTEQNNLPPVPAPTTVSEETKSDSRVLGTESDKNNNLPLNLSQNLPLTTTNTTTTQEKPTSITIVNGVTSLQNQTGNLSLVAGSGIGIDGLTIVNTDKGSTQYMFKSILVPDNSSITADANNDSLTINASNGIKIVTDSVTKKITIAQTNSFLLQPNGLTYAKNNTSVETLTTGVSGQILKSNGAAAPPSWIDLPTVNTPSTGVFSTLAVSGSIAFTSLPTGILRINASGVVSSSSVNLQTDVNSILPISSGGTGLQQLTAGDLLYYTAGSSLTPLGIGATSTVLVSSGSKPVWSSSLSLPGSLSVQGVSTFKGNVGIGTTALSQFHVYMGSARALIQTQSNGALSPLNLWNSDTGPIAGAGMLFTAGSSPTAGFIGGMLSQRIDAALNSRTVLRVLSNGGLSAGDATAPFYLEGSTTGPKIIANAKLGIGTTNPAEKIHVANGSIRIDGGALCVGGTSAGCQGMAPGRIYASNTTVQAADLAENYISSQKLEPGDVIMPEGSDTLQAVIKTTKKNEPAVLGVVSTKPGVTLNSDAEVDQKHPYIVAIALSGRVPVKVSLENGDITIGDSLTTSSKAGIAMKANGSSASVIGKSLENYSSKNPDEIKLIMVYVNLSWKSNEIAEIITPTPTILVTKPTENTEYKNISVSDKTTVNILDINGTLSLGSLQLNKQDNSANIFSTDGPLQIQSNALNAVHFFGDKIILDTNGKIYTKNTVTVKKLDIDDQESSSSAIGTAEIPDGQREVTVKTDVVTAKSKIFVTPNTPVLIGVTQKKPGESFTIQLDKEASGSAKIDWWVIN